MSQTLIANDQIPTLDALRAPAGAVSMNSQNLTNVATPVNPGDACTKQYADNAIQGVATKVATCATTAALAANTYANGTSGVGATLTATANAALAAIDGHTPVAGDIVLVKNEATAANDGLYTVTQVGDSTHPYILTRATNMDDSSEFNSALVFVENGTTYQGSRFLYTGAASPTVGTTSISFTELADPGGYTGGNGITITGTSIATNPDGTSLDNLGTGGALEIAANGVTSAKIASNAVTNGKIAISAYQVDTALAITGGGATGATVTLSQTPVGFLLVTRNGQVLTPGSGHDYVQSGTTVTAQGTEVWQTGDIISAMYFR